MNTITPYEFATLALELAKLRGRNFPNEFDLDSAVELLLNCAHQIADYRRAERESHPLQEIKPGETK